MHPIAVVQVEYSPFTTDIEDEKIGLLKAARELGVKIVAYGALGRGLLTGKYVRWPTRLSPLVLMAFLDGAITVEKAGGLCRG